MRWNDNIMHFLDLHSAKNRFSHTPVTIYEKDNDKVTARFILSVNEKLQVSKFRYFGKYIIQLDGYFCIHVSDQRQTGLEKNTSFTSPGIMVHMMHVLFVLFAVF